MVFRPAREQPGYHEWREKETCRREQLAASAASAASFLVGTWLVLAPFVLGFGTTGGTVTGYWNEIVIGVVVALLALVHAFASGEAPWPSIVNAMLGLWLIASPFVLGHEGPDAPAAISVDVSAGVVIAITAIVSATLTRRSRSRSRSRSGQE